MPHIARAGWLLCCLTLALTMASPTEPAPRIDISYPGGAILVEAFQDDVFHLRPDLRDTEGWWFYWNFRVLDGAGRRLTFQFHGGDPIGARGPAVSLDGGETWSWLGREACAGGAFTFAIPPQSQEARFAMSIPYQDRDLTRFLASHRDHPDLEIAELCRTPKGRVVQKLRLGRRSDPPFGRLLFTARHHACESIASFTLEGLIAEILSDSETGRWYRQHTQVLAIPFMDMDGVEDGDQGKNRRPHDHNCDYQGDSLYPEVRALKQELTAWAGDRLVVSMDMHCPYLSGYVDGPGTNEHIFFVATPGEAQWSNLEKLSALLKQATAQSPLPFDGRCNMPWGQSWNAVEGTHINAKYMALWPHIRIATSLEVPYANAGGATVTAEGARLFGRDLAVALRQFLIQDADLPPSPTPSPAPQLEAPVR